MTNVMNIAQKSSFKKVFAIALICAIIMAMACPVMLAGDDSATTLDDTADKVVGKILGFVLTIFTYIGVILLVWSVGQLVLAFKNEDADSKSRAIMLLVVSLILIFLKAAMNGILDATGTGIKIS